MHQWVRGQKAKLSDLTQSQQVEIGINIVGKPGVTVDVSCFGLDEAGKLSDDRYFIFYNQRASPCRSVVAHGAQHGDAETFRVDLSTLPATIKRLVRTLPGASGPTLAARLAALRLDEVELEDWEEVVDPAAGEQPVFDACADELDVLVDDLIRALLPRSG